MKNVEEALCRKNFERILGRKKHTKILEEVLHSEYLILKKLKKEKPYAGPFINKRKSLLRVYEEVKLIVTEVIGEKIIKDPKISLDKRFKDEGEYEYESEERKIRIRPERKSKVKMTMVHEIVHHIINEKFPRLSERYVHFEEGLGSAIEKRISRIFEKTEKRKAYLLATLDSSVWELEHAFKYNCYLNYKSLPRWVINIEKMYERPGYPTEDLIKIKYLNTRIFITKYVLGNGVFSIFSELYGEDFYRSIFDNDGDFNIFLKR